MSWGVVETGQGPLCHISHPYWPAVAVPGALSCPCPSFGVLALAHIHFADARVLLPPGLSPSSGSPDRWEWDIFLPSASPCPRCHHGAVSPLALQLQELCGGGRELCSRATVSPPRNISPNCSVCPLAPNREASSRGFLFNFSII